MPLTFPFLSSEVSLRNVNQRPFSLLKTLQQQNRSTLHIKTTNTVINFTIKHNDEGQWISFGWTKR